MRLWTGSGFIHTREATAPVISPVTLPELRPSAPVSESARVGNRRADVRAAFTFIAPAVLFVGLWTYFPAALAFLASFFQIPLSGDGWRFVGLGNYASVIADSDVRQAVWNTVLYCVLSIVPSVALGLGAALLTNTVGHGRGLLSTLLFLPLTANLVAMAVVFQWVFAFNGGLANQVLALAGAAPVNFLAGDVTALPTVAALGVWRSASFCMVFFLAGLTTIPTSLHEAAAMDGLRGWAKLRWMVLPLLRPAVVLATVVATLQAVQIFEAIRVMTDGGPLGATESILTITWRIGFGFFQLGGAAALSFLLLVVLLVVGLLRRRAILRGVS